MTATFDVPSDSTKRQKTMARHMNYGTKLFKGMALRKIFGPKMDEVTGKLKTLHNKELYDQYSSPNIIQVTKSRRMRWE
jgi:hypothetical protein